MEAFVSLGGACGAGLETICASLFPFAAAFRRAGFNLGFLTAAGGGGDADVVSGAVDAIFDDF